MYKGICKEGLGNIVQDRPRKYCCQNIIANVMLKMRRGQSEGEERFLQ